jgi:hypothetical protein
MFALFIRQQQRMRHIVFSPVAFLAVPYFSHYFINGTIFGKKKCFNVCCSVDFRI